MPKNSLKLKKFKIKITILDLATCEPNFVLGKLRFNDHKKN